jgi:hypothetical protein
MFARTMQAAGILALLCGAAEAQDGLRSAALPEPTLRSPVADDRDLFRVPQDFYNRRPDSDGSRLFFPQPLPTLVWNPNWPDTIVPVHGFTGASAHRFRFTGSHVLGCMGSGSVVHACSGSGVTERSEAAPETTASPSATPPRMAPGEPKIFYVIPGCYAGDRPPALEWLPRGCDTSKMRVVTPTPVPSSPLRKAV